MNLRQMKVLNKSKLVKLNKNTQHLQILNKAQAMQILYKKNDNVKMERQLLQCDLEMQKNNQCECYKKSNKWYKIQTKIYVKKAHKINQLQR